jgi:hypothetical protein
MLVGLGLVGFGLVLAGFAYLVLSSVPLAALGLACVVLGATAASLPENVVPRSAVRAMLRGATLNIEALLEEFDVRGGAVYLPPRDGLVSAYLPVASNPGPPSLEALRGAPRRVVTLAGGQPCLMVFPPGAEVVRVSELGEGVGLEEALSYILVDVTELCSSLRASEAEDVVVLEMRGVKAETEAPRYRELLGSIPSSLAACVVAAVLRRPVRLLGEEFERASGLH